jgi:hypothetical protein
MRLFTVALVKMKLDQQKFRFLDRTEGDDCHRKKGKFVNHETTECYYRVSLTESAVRYIVV